MDEQRIIYLIRQYELGNITAAEEQEFDEAINDENNAELLSRIIASEFENHETEASFLLEDYTEKIEKILNIDRDGIKTESSLPSPLGEGARRADEVEEFDTGALWREIEKRVGQEGKVIRMGERSWKKYTTVAAAVLIFLGGSVFFWIHNRTTKDTAVVKIVPGLKNDVAPGHNGAILKLADGTSVVLDSAANGNLAVQGNTKVVKLDNGQLTYTAEKSKVSEEILYNELSTPKGRQFQIRLPDGSHVWLNAASSIRYPTAFTGKERVVEMTGEAYFEVAHNAYRPFHVKVNGIDVQVLGTHFNVNAYDDEEVATTTLLEGKVQMSSGITTTFLEPGQQGIQNKEGVIKVTKADVEQTVAWKNGIFKFNHTDLRMVMRQLSRWYDVDISYEGNVLNKYFNGEMPRDVNVSVVLTGLQYMGVHFDIEGKKLIVRP